MAARPIARVLLSLLIGIVVVGVGYLIEPALWAAFQGGASASLAQLAASLGAPSSIAVPALVAGSATGVVALSGRTLAERIYRGVAAAVFVLVVLDSFTMLISGPALTMTRYLFSIASDVVGGAIAGAVAGYLIDRIAAAAPQRARARTK